MNDLQQGMLEFAEPSDSPIVEPSSAGPTETFAIGERKSIKAMIQSVQAARRHIDDYKATFGQAAHSIEFDGEIVIRKAIVKSIARLCDEGRRAFGFAGTPAAIDDEEVRERFWPRREEPPCESYDPVVVWNHLRETYGRTGKLAALSAAAHAILRQIKVERGQPPEISAGRRTFQVYCHSRKNTGQGKSYQVCDDDRYASQMHAFLRAIGTFIAWSASMDAVPQEVTNDIEAAIHFLRVDGTFEMRHAIPIGPTTLVLFASKAELKMAPNLGDALMLFITEFAGEQLAYRLS